MKRINQDNITLFLALLFLTALLTVLLNVQPEPELEVDVTGCESQACEDMLEEVQSADLSSFIVAE